ncbi:MAG: LysM peptidoglycan-binding domain-containing protein [Deltaproteobacteria bacterium]|nr:LysM peptidoglycan-binding domain-containing protein [Kofleriaceae bacterium]
MRRVLASFVFALLPATVAAETPEPAPRPAGAQDERATPAPVVRAPLPDRLDGRAAVRGCPVDSECQRWQDELREFEIEAFSPEAGPWRDGETRRPSAPARGVKPTDLRPDLPWLADLELPDLPVVWDSRVIDYLVFYKEDPRGRRIMRGWLERQGRYRDMIVKALRRAKLPEDLLYVCMIESSYDASTYSRVGASGLWQFMPAGGRIYGLAIDRWVDERNEPIASTEAVLDYWADLHQRFGDWHLAMAAYNAGYGAVLKGIARFNTNDFWALLDYENALPWESSIYVPKALAAAIVGRNRAVFGFDDIKDAPAEAWDDVTVPKSITLATIATAAGTSLDEIKRLNPHLRRGRTPPGRSFVVRVPRGGGERFAARLGELRGDWEKFDTYVVGYGERFEDVATQFGISRSKLKELNEVEHESEVTGGTILVVPRVSEADRRANLEKAKDELYGSGVDHKPGEALIVPVPDKDAHEEGKRRVFYRVVFGDSLTGVARAMGVKVATLAKWNGLASDAKLHPRMVLQAWVADDWREAKANVRLLDETRILVVTRGSKEHLELSEARTGRERVEYTAKKRESFEQIGKKFGLGKRDVARINKKSPDTVVEPGETIVVYKVVDHTRSDRAEKQWKQLPKAERKKAGATKKPETKADAKPKAEKDDGKKAEASKAEAPPVEEADADVGPVTTPE